QPADPRRTAGAARLPGDTEVSVVSPPTGHLSAPTANGPALLAPPPYEPEHVALERAWGRKPGILGWIVCTDHKAIGLRFITTAFVFFALGGLLALMMRLQLARPSNTVLGPDTYNQFFTTHGTTMMFLFA